MSGRHALPKQPIRLTRRGKVVVGLAVLAGLMAVLVGLAWIVAEISLLFF